MNSKDKTYSSILVIIDKLRKITYYEQVEIKINTLALTEIIIKMVMRHNGLSDLIVYD